MSAFLNRRAAELLELAAKSHRRAADFLELGDTRGCTDYANEGLDRVNFAVEVSREAAHVSAQIHLDSEPGVGSPVFANGG